MNTMDMGIWGITGGAVLTIITGQIVSNPLDPLGGWGTIVVQGGAFALLAYLLTIEFPRARKEAKEERETRDRLFTELLSKVQDKFEERNELMRTSIQNQTERLVSEMKEMTKVNQEGFRQLNCK